jgi:RNA polymerase sigma factor (sigma-70 family)
MDETDALASRFETHRPHLRAVAYRMLGSLSEADDAVQEAWLRLSGAESSGVQNLAGWLTTVVGRICLNLLRARAARGEQQLVSHIPDPIVTRVEGGDPEQQALVGEKVGLALLVVLDSLTPAERLAFVLHDVFGMPFDDIAPIIEGTTCSAARQPRSPTRSCGADAGCRPRAPTQGRRLLLRRGTKRRLRDVAGRPRPGCRAAIRRRRNAGERILSHPWWQHDRQPGHHVCRRSAGGETGTGQWRGGGGHRARRKATVDHGVHRARRQRRGHRRPYRSCAPRTT